MKKLLFTLILICYALCVITPPCNNCQDRPGNNKLCRNNKDCPRNHRCKNKRCQRIIVVNPEPNRCDKCLPTEKCVFGKCIPDDNQVEGCNSDYDCGPSEVCSSKKCVPKIQYCYPRCATGTKCVNGKCELDIKVCPQDSRYEAVVCTQPRPNKEQCPQLFYIVAPDVNVCGITADGTKLGYARFCEACQNPDVVYYFKSPCHQTPFICGESETCNGQFCTKSCVRSEECPYDWQVCYNGQCVSDCYLKRCQNCLYSQCMFQEPPINAGCLGDPLACSKKDYWTCVGNQCTDPCTKNPCPPYHKCNRYGQCEPEVNPAS